LLRIILDLVSLALLGSLVGFTGAFLGVGGGFILVPLLTLLFGLDPHHAVGTSLATIMFTGAFSASAYFRQRRLDWRLGLLTEISTMPGGLAGSLLTAYVTSKELKNLFAIFLIILALSMIIREDYSRSKREGKKVFPWKRSLRDSSGIEFDYQVDILKLLLMGILAGLASGFFGIGGGVIKVPVLYNLGVPIHIAIATSTFMITLTAFSGTIGHTILGHVLWIKVLGIVPGLLLGTRLGARVAYKAESKILRGCFSSVLMIMALLLLME